MKTKQRLQDVLSGPEKWQQHEYARFAGRHVDFASVLRGAAADSFCLIGGGAAANGETTRFHGLVHDEIEARLKCAIFAAGFGTVDRVDCWNDHPTRTFDDIRKVTIKYDEMYPVSANTAPPTI